MPNLLRLRESGPQWPYSVAQFRADEPQLSISDNPHEGELATYADLDPPILVFAAKPTDPPTHDPAIHRPQEVRPACVDGVWQQAWELIELPPPPEPEPQPDWAQFRQALRQENGYGSAFQSALSADPMAGVQLAIGLDRFRREGDYADFLEALGNSLSVLPTDQAAHIALELLALAGRCDLPLSFREALQAMFEQ
jgi:hypothetical protein